MEFKKALSFTLLFFCWTRYVSHDTRQANTPHILVVQSALYSSIHHQHRLSLSKISVFQSSPTSWLQASIPNMKFYELFTCFLCRGPRESDCVSAGISIPTEVPPTPPTKSRCFILGLSGAGKSTFLCRIRTGKFQEMRPTEDYDGIIPTLPNQTPHCTAAPILPVHYNNQLIRQKKTNSSRGPPLQPNHEPHRDSQQ